MLKRPQNSGLDKKPGERLKFSEKFVKRKSEYVKYINSHEAAYRLNPYSGDHILKNRQR